ncbi:MAG: hypothetical protein U9O24_01885 [Campylobacterota bacterium]|nr:hypothetical protein [Campylobacterota bacterium]
MKDLTKNEKLLIDEIKVIQDIIKRMADNSFKIKGWTVTLIVITLIFKGKSDTNYLLAFLPLFSFWILDTYYLRTERIYRKLYGWVVKNRPTSDEFLFDLNPKRFESDVDDYLKTMFSISLRMFYGGLLVLLLFISCLDFLGSV